MDILENILLFTLLDRRFVLHPLIFGHSEAFCERFLDLGHAITASATVSTTRGAAATLELGPFFGFLFGFHALFHESVDVFALDIVHSLVPRARFRLS